MCATCGCNQEEKAKVTMYFPGENPTEEMPEDSLPEEHHTHHHHQHAHEHKINLQMDVERDILEKNNRQAEYNRGFFEAAGCLVVNLMSSPGSGKTTLLEATIRQLHSEHEVYVIEGDQQSDRDSRRLADLDVPVMQINTGQKCHLDAHMVMRAVRKLNPGRNSILFIENVGNLVCPALFDLGERARVVIMSTTEGDDKPVKYPYIFEKAHLVLINKSDLLPYLNFDVERATRYLRQINHHADILTLSAEKGDRLKDWVHWLLQRWHTYENASYTS